MGLRVLLYKLNSIADECIPPISLGYLAACSANHDVEILDGQRLELKDVDVVKYCLSHNIEVFGLSAMTKDLPSSRELLRKLKTSIPDLITVVGGTQPWLMPTETLSFYGDVVDCVFGGESELSLPAFLNCIQEGGNIEEAIIPGTVYRKKDGAEVSNSPCRIENLDSIPFPRWDLMPPRAYPHAPHGGFFRQFPIAPMITSRGCPYSCTFCSSPVMYGRRIRFRGLDTIFEEIELLYTKFGVREIHFEDDNFSLRRNFVLEFCDRMLSTGHAITWGFPNGIRLDTLDDEVLSAMKKAGAYALNFGIESGDDETLKLIKKKIDTKEIAARIRMVKNYGFSTGGFFIIGFPWETAENILRTFEFARKLDLDRVGFSYFQPFPGTDLTKWLIEREEFKMDLESFHTSLHDITFVPEGMTKAQLQNLRRIGLAKYYSNPKRIYKILSGVKTPQHLAAILKRGMRWLRA